MGLFGEKANSVEPLLREILGEIKILRSEIKTLSSESQDLKKVINELKQKESEDVTQTTSSLKLVLSNQVKISRQISNSVEEFIEPTFHNVRNVQRDLKEELIK